MKAMPTPKATTMLATMIRRAVKIDLGRGLLVILQASAMSLRLPASAPDKSDRLADLPADGCLVLGV